MTRRILSSVALGILLAAPGAAMAGRFTKPTIDMQGLPDPPRRVPAPNKNTQAAPRMTVEEFLGRQQARIQDINDRQIVYLRRLIRIAGPEDPQLPDYYFRLGELFAEKYRYFDNLARNLDEPIFRAEHARDSNSAAQPR